MDLSGVYFGLTALLFYLVFDKLDRIEKKIDKLNDKK